MTERDCNGVEALLQSLGSPSADRDYRPGHDRVCALLACCPPRRPRLRIRVAGTNGKGSTAAMVAAGLRAAGLRVGLYTSPHLHRFHERIRVEGVEVDDAALRGVLHELLPTARRVGASYFEVATAAALVLFSRAEVDAEVLEAGVGARLDATTAVPADLALLTPVARDHCAWLGTDLSAIAAEKAAVGDGCRWLLSARQPEEVRSVVKRAHPDAEFVDPDETLDCTMAGAFQRQNGALALRALALLRRAGWIDAEPEALRAAVCAVRLPGRLQQFSLRGRTLWLDVAHNAHAVAHVAEVWSQPCDAVLVYTREDRSLVSQRESLRACGRLLIGPGQDGVWDRTADTVEEALRMAITRESWRSLLVLGSFTTVAVAQRWIVACGGEEVL